MNLYVPSYLRGYEELYGENPPAAALQWFKNAKFGLFIHYGLYAFYGRNCPVIWKENIPIAEYKKNKERFTAEKFDVDFITDLALEAGMKYVNITSRHHEGFCLFRTKETDFSSVNSPAERDLIAELAEVCRKKGLGLFLYYSYGLDWTHPWFPTEESGITRAPRRVEGYHQWKKNEDIRHYINFMHAQLRELLTQYGSVAGIWLDPISSYYDRPDLFPIGKTYALIRSLQPQCLISYKQGANGEEDFVAPEKLMEGKDTPLGKRIWEKNKDKPGEVNTMMQVDPPGWGYVKGARHRSAEDVMTLLADAAYQKANLLLDTGPLPDGSIHPEDVVCFREVGARIKKDGFPKPSLLSDKRRRPWRYKRKKSLNSI